MKSDAGKANSKPRRILRYAAYVTVIFIVSGASVSRLINWWCYARPPKMDSFPPIVHEEVRTEVESSAEAETVRRSIGTNWMARSYGTEGTGIISMYLDGDPFSRGYANVMLTQTLLQQQEVEFIGLIREHVPSTVKLWLLSKLVLLRNRRLPEFVRLEDQFEIYGGAVAYEDPHPHLGPVYNRFLNYHAAHDIAYAVVDSMLMGCTSFVARDDATADGNMLIGRNFDFSVSQCFDRNKVVVLTASESGYRYISVSWPGVVGVVSGINEKRIGVFIHAATSEDSRLIATPVSLVMRETLQYAGTLDEAAAIIARSAVSVSNIYLIADGKTNDAIVVEKTPKRAVVHRMTGNTMILSNHFLTDELRDDTGNQRYLSEGTSLIRYNRMRELVDKYTDIAKDRKLTIDEAARILRDTYVPGVPPGALGHPAALASMEATHTVIVDMTRGIIWVSNAPHQLGEFVPFSIEAFGGDTGEAVIPAAAALQDGSYQRYVAGRRKLREAQMHLRKRRWREAASAAQEAADLNPADYRARIILGRCAMKQRDWPTAVQHLRDAQSRHIAYGSERAEVAELLTELESKLLNNAQPQ